MLYFKLILVALKLVEAEGFAPSSKETLNRSSTCLVFLLFYPPSLRKMGFIGGESP